jgi:hypothetical protein
MPFPWYHKPKSPLEAQYHYHEDVRAPVFGNVHPKKEPKFDAKMGATKVELAQSFQMFILNAMSLSVPLRGRTQSWRANMMRVSALGRSRLPVWVLSNVWIMSNRECYTRALL